MRAAAAFDISVCRFEWWRLACGGVSGLSAVVLFAWCVAERPDGLVLPVIGALAVCLALSAMSLRRPRSQRLRWDTQCWSLAVGDEGSGDPGAMVPGRLSVAIDLGPWLLLKFMPQASRLGRVVWLPVQKRGLAPRWHALRCALYGARPVPDESTRSASSAVQ